jgi:hypothetical protein
VLKTAMRAGALPKANDLRKTAGQAGFMGASSKLVKSNNRKYPQNYRLSTCPA